MKFLDKYGIWYPEFETEPDELMVYLVRKVTDCDVVSKYVKTKCVAVQAGCHLGLWPRRLAKQFEFVHTFEAVPELIECSKLNLASTPQAILTAAALGATVGTCQFSKRSGGRGKIHEGGDFEAKMVSIDSLQLVRCDLIYLDIERGELAALEGAKETIAAHSPVIALEVLSGEDEKVRAWARANRYEPIEKIHNDWILTRPKKN